MVKIRRPRKLKELVTEHDDDRLRHRAARSGTAGTPGLGELLKRAAEEIEMLGATVDDEDTSMHQAVREAILNERSACATLADQAGCPAVAETIRARPSPVSS